MDVSTKPAVGSVDQPREKEWVPRHGVPSAVPNCTYYLHTIPYMVGHYPLWLVSPFTRLHIAHVELAPGCTASREHLPPRASGVGRGGGD